MWRYSLLLLVALPPIAIALDSAVLLILWTMLVIPICIAQCMDYLRTPTLEKRVFPFRFMLRGLVGLFGGPSMAIGASLVLWCLYNVGIKRLPEYSGPGGVLELFVEGFGISPALFSFGLYLLRLALRRGNSNNRAIQPWVSE